jgi:hypothetical protein
MTDQSLDAVGSQGDVIIDGPFGENALFAAALAALRAPQRVFRSNLREGTAAGAALIGRMSAAEDLPRLKLNLTPVEPLAGTGVQGYRSEWLALAAGR